MLEKVRKSSESCDGALSIPIFSDIDNAFGGILCNLVDEIRDYYGNAVCLPVYGIRSSSNKNRLEFLNIASVYSNIFEKIDVLFPLNLVDEQYFSIAAAVESVSYISRRNAFAETGIHRISDKEWLQFLNFRQFPLCDIDYFGGSGECSYSNDDSFKPIWKDLPLSHSDEYSSNKTDSTASDSKRLFFRGNFSQSSKSQ